MAVSGGAAKGGIVTMETDGIKDMGSSAIRAFFFFLAGIQKYCTFSLTCEQR